MTSDGGTPIQALSISLTFPIVGLWFIKQAEGGFDVLIIKG